MENVIFVEGYKFKSVSVNERNKLIELVRKSGASFENALPEEIVDYLLLNGVTVQDGEIKEQLCLKNPLSQWEFAYTILDEKVYQVKIESITFFKKSAHLKGILWDRDEKIWRDCLIPENEIGKTVFFSEKEAEEKIKEKKIDVEAVKQGEWIDISSYDDGENAIATCSNCHTRGKVRTNRNRWGLWYIDSPRCPHCGARIK